MIDLERDQSENGPTRVLNQYIAATICSMLAFSYGHTIGWSSTAIPQLEKGGRDMPTGEEGIDSFVSGWIGGSYCLGALIAAPVFGILADKKGRKFAGYVVGLCFVLHWGLISFGTNIAWILAGRAIGGAGGAGSITVPSIYNNEIAVDKIRGGLGGFLALFYASGIFFSYIMGAYFSFYMVLYTYLTISIVFFFGWWLMPESPAYLVLKGKDEIALKALSWLRSIPTKYAIKPLLEIKLHQAGAKKPSSIIKFWKNPSARRGMLLSVVITAVQTFSGIFAIHSYASSIFKRAGNALNPFTATLIYGLLMSVGAVVPPLFVDKVGRKVLLGWSCGGLSICMGVMGTYFYALNAGYVNESDTFLMLLPVIVLSTCVVIYYTGLGSVTYITMNELFTDEYRGVAGSFIAIAIWGTSFFLLQFFAPAVKIFGDHIVFYFFCAVSVFGTFFVCIFIPETKGRNPVDIAESLVKKR